MPYFVSFILDCVYAIGASQDEELVSNFELTEKMVMVEKEVRQLMGGILCLHLPLPGQLVWPWYHGQEPELR